MTFIGTSYKDVNTSQSSDSVKTYRFFCAQLNGQETKTQLVDDHEKCRICLKMDRFNCYGWLHITMQDSNLKIAKIQLSHHEPHCHYVNIALDDKVKRLVKELKNLTLRQVCHSIFYHPVSENRNM